VSVNEKKNNPFEEIAEKKGYTPRKKKRKEPNCAFVTHILKGKKKNGEAINIKVDLKKVKNKKQDQDWLWIEFKNPEGKDGWLYGDAHFIVFERTNDFIFVNRKELLCWISASNKIRYDLPYVTLAKKAKYRIYKRKGGNEQISQIHVSDIKSLKSFQIWNKNADAKPN
jgi:hypothetical protein